jgi:hypothetical protein
LGASNLTRSFSTAVGAARQIWGAPVEIMAAMGHGRSYGQDSCVLGRKISGIFPCALWQDLQNRPVMPTAALITDIGNDLLYGVSPEQLLEWLEGCLDRLKQADATIVMTQLPIASIERLSEARFRFFKNILFPRSKLTLGDARFLVRALNERLIALGEVRKIPVITVSDAWYGFNPIHIRRRFFRQAWPALLSSGCNLDFRLEAPRPSLLTTAYLATLSPWERSLFGIRRRAAQPSGRLPDGTTISLY